MVYVTRGHCRIGRCVGVCQWEFLIIDVRNELILEFKNEPVFQGEVRVFRTDVYPRQLSR